MVKVRVRVRVRVRVKVRVHRLHHKLEEVRGSNREGTMRRKPCLNRFKYLFRKFLRDGNLDGIESMRRLLNTTRLGRDSDVLEVVNCSLDERIPALHLAIKHDCLEVVQLLLEFGAAIERRDEENRTPLLYAASLPSRTHHVICLLEAGW